MLESPHIDWSGPAGGTIKLGRSSITTSGAAHERIYNCNTSLEDNAIDDGSALQDAVSCSRFEESLRARSPFDLTRTEARLYYVSLRPRRTAIRRRVYHLRKLLAACSGSLGASLGGPD